MNQEEFFFEQYNGSAFGMSHVGRVQKTNEDRCLIRPLENERLLFAVADGLGGGMSGDIASRIMIETLGRADLQPGPDLEKVLTGLVMTADRDICARITKRPELEGMATTLVCGILQKNRLYWINVGDSRLYLFRDNELTQISSDQTLAHFLLKEGEITPEQALTHYSKDLLDQCIGYGECDPQTGVLDVRENDQLLFVTDGLYKMVSDNAIQPLLKKGNSVREQVYALVESAIEAGGLDNITVVLVNIRSV